MENKTALAHELRHAKTANAEAAMEKIYKIHQGKMLHIAVRILQDTSEAEEVVNDTFHKLWINRSTINDDQHIEGFLKVALRYACINAAKKLARENRLPPDFQNNFEQATAISSLQEIDRLNLVLKIADTMPRQTRDVFILHYAHKKSHQEIANELDISYKTVKAQASRGRQIIAKKLSKSADRDDFLMLLFACYIGSTYSA